MVGNSLPFRLVSLRLSSMFSSDGSDRSWRLQTIFGSESDDNGSSEFWSAALVTAIAGVALALTIFCSSRRVHLKSPWSRKRRRHVLSPQQWRSLFTPEGKLRDGGIRFLKKVRNGGVHQSIRKEVWPLLLGVYDLNSTSSEREAIKAQKRLDYLNLRSRTNAERASEERKTRGTEDFTTWQRIIRVDAVRANAEWVPHAPPCQTDVSADRAGSRAESVGLRDYEHLEPHRTHHAARLVSILEAYALYDPEIGYCQGMSDLLSPVIAFLADDSEAFWCFAGFMRKARHNFRLDEAGIRRQLGVVSSIIRCRDSGLFRHLEKMRAEDCFFVYRMVVVMFRRELSFEQTVSLWEVVWADQAAVRAGAPERVASPFGAVRWAAAAAPPSDDLLLYAIAACVLRRRRRIIEKYSSMDEIIRECNSMAGHLDVWKLLDDAHDLILNLRDKIPTSF